MEKVAKYMLKDKKTIGTEHIKQDVEMRCLVNEVYKENGGQVTADTCNAYINEELDRFSNHKVLIRRAVDRCFVLVPDVSKVKYNFQGRLVFKKSNRVVN